MIKIVFIISSLTPKSGSERVACNLANLLADEYGYELSIVNRDTNFDNSAYYLNEVISVVPMQGNYLSFFKQLQKYICTIRPKYIVVHNMGRLSLLCSLLNTYEAKIISLEHVAFISRPKWVQLLSKLCYKAIDQVVTLTYKDLSTYQKWFKNCMVIYNISPFDISDQSIEREKRVIAVGRLTYQKNFHALLLAWQKIQAEIGDWVLEIYGIGEDLEELELMISVHQLKSIFLKGQAYNIEEVYKKSSIFVMSSRYEGLPMVLIEAQTFGLPIISFDCPFGPSEVIINNKNGLLVENQNIDKLAQSLLDLMQDPIKLEILSAQAKIDAERFQRNNVLKTWEEQVFID